MRMWCTLTKSSGTNPSPVPHLTSTWFYRSYYRTLRLPGSWSYLTKSRTWSKDSMPAFLIGNLGVTGSTLIGALILDFIIQWVRLIRETISPFSETFPLCSLHIIPLLPKPGKSFKAVLEGADFADWVGIGMHLQNREILWRIWEHRFHHRHNCNTCIHPLLPCKTNHRFHIRLDLGSAPRRIPTFQSPEDRQRLQICRGAGQAR